MRAPASTSVTDQPLFGRHYTIAGQRVWADRRGAGGPAVVFLPGAGLVGPDYLNLHLAISRTTTSILYDRRGTGWSDEVGLPRSAKDVARELRELLQAVEVVGPVVLVGHSLGGAYARRFAQLFPGEVAGLVLLDPAHEGYLDTPRQSALAQARDALRLIRPLLGLKRFYRALFETMLQAWPDGLRERLIDDHLSTLTRTMKERHNLWTGVLPEVARGGSEPDVPVTVLVAMGIDPFQAPFSSEAWLTRLNDFKLGFYRDFVATRPQGALRTVEAGHSTIHTQAPGPVVAAIEEVLAAVRTQTPLAATAA